MNLSTNNKESCTVGNSPINHKKYNDCLSFHTSFDQSLINSSKVISFREGLLNMLKVPKT